MFRYLCPQIMKTKSIKRDKVNIITLGCSKNMVDSEVLSGQLLANEIDTVHESGKRDHNIVIINTCGFIEKAKEESINTILDNIELKPTCYETHQTPSHLTFNYYSFYI